MLNHIDLCMSTCDVVLKIYQDVQLYNHENMATCRTFGVFYYIYVLKISMLIKNGGICVVNY